MALIGQPLASRSSPSLLPVSSHIPLPHSPFLCFFPQRFQLLLFLKKHSHFLFLKEHGGQKFLATVVWPPVQVSKNNQTVHTGPINLLLALVLCPYCARRVSVPSFDLLQKAPFSYLHLGRHQYHYYWGQCCVMVKYRYFEARNFGLNSDSAPCQLCCLGKT